MKKSNKREMITVDEYNSAFQGTNFGPDPDYKDLVKWGLMKTATGYLPGYTMLCVMRELGLVNQSRLNRCLTARGRYCLWGFFKDEYRRQMD